MEQHARVIVTVVGVAADMVPPFDNKAALAQPRGKPFSQHGTRETGTYYEKIKHCSEGLRTEMSGIGGLTVERRWFTDQTSEHRSDVKISFLTAEL